MSKQTDFIAKIAPLAQKYGKLHNVCCSMTMAQAILESGWGKSCIGGFALFGVKGKGLNCETKEFINGKWITIRDNFVTYKSYEDSFKGYYAFLENNARYKKAGIFGDWNYKSVCKKMQKSGYATAPNYAESLIGIIEDYKLYIYDKVGSSVPSPAPTPPSKPKTYTVKSGDSWWRIAEQQLGSGSKMETLANFNGMQISSVIHPGQVLKMP